jgi:hypothetical protein
MTPEECAFPWSRSVCSDRAIEIGNLVKLFDTNYGEPNPSHH